MWNMWISQFSTILRWRLLKKLERPQTDVDPNSAKVKASFLVNCILGLLIVILYTCTFLDDFRLLIVSIFSP